MSSTAPPKPFERNELEIGHERYGWIKVRGRLAISGVLILAGILGIAAILVFGLPNWEW